MSSSSADTITSSEPKQIAVLGHALIDRHFFDRCQTFGVSTGWFNMAGWTYQTIWKEVSAFVAKQKRHPTMGEILALATPDMGKEAMERFKADVKRAADAAREIGQDVLIPELRFWAIGAIIIESFNPGSPFEVAFNHEHDIPKAVELLWETTHTLTRIQEAGETTNRFQLSSQRVMGERAERQRLATKALKFGVPFLDEATGGIWPTDLIVIGAPSGKGKTDLCTTIARNVTKAGKRVAFFALEASENEIERRARYSVASRLYFAASPASGRHISYRDYLFGNLEKELGPFEDLSLPRFCGHHGYEEDGVPWDDENDGSSPRSTRPRWSSWFAPAARASGRWPASWS